jgi:rhodanese-related sulfurtransferase
VVYCKSGNRSGLAATILEQNGINSVINGGSLEALLNQNQ